MSLKPPKKSDLDKHWMRSRQNQTILFQPEHHLIITEGTKTEPQYFEAIREVINQDFRDKIRLEINGEGDNTLHLLKKQSSESVPAELCINTSGFAFMGHEIITGLK